MLFDTTNHCQQSKNNWDTMPTIQQTQNPTNFANFHSRINQPPVQQTRVPQFQKNEARSTRRYSSGTPTNNYGLPIAPTMTQSMNGGAGRRVGSKGTYRSATFHQPNNSFNNYRQSQPNQQPQSGGQLRTSSSFHGCIQQSQQQQTPQMSYTGRNSYTASHQQPNQCKTSIYTVSGNFHPGMKDVPIWLKSLRLHKYTRMFQELSYDDMMELDDQKLEQRQVTKGARKKILQSLDKLRDRSQLIRQLEKCIDEHGDVRCLIVELRAMMSTPIAAYKPSEEPKPSNYVIDAIGIPASDVSDENLPGHLSRLCLRLHEFLFRNGLPKIQELGIEDEYLLKLLQVYDKILGNEAFTYRQRYCIFECKRVISRYMCDQKILGGNNQSSLVPPYNQQTVPSTQPALVSSPSSGYHTMSPPSSSTRRNSDTKESVEDLTATTTATNSDDDFHANSAPSSPPAPFLNQYQYQQLNQMSLRHSPEQWSQQQPSSQQVQCPPGFEWLHSSSNGNNSASQQPKSAANLLHFQPYVNDHDQFMNIGSMSQMQQRSNNVWFNQPQETSQLNFSSVQRQNQWDQNEKSNLNSLFDSKPTLCNFLASQLEQQPHQASIAKPPKATSPIGTRPANYMQKSEATEPLTICDKFKLLENDDDGPEILNLAFQFAMKVKSQKSREGVTQKPIVQQPVLWQNVKDQHKQQQTQNNLWSNVAPAKQANKPNAISLYSALNDQRIHLPNEFGKKQEFYDPWSTSTSQQQDLSLSDQLTASTTSTAPSDSNLFGNVKPQTSTPLESNCLNRMLNDNQICGGQSQQHQRIMRQYLPDELTQNENRLFSGITRSEDLRALLNDHASTETMFTAFQPLSYTSGAVH